MSAGDGVTDLTEFLLEQLGGGLVEQLIFREIEHLLVDLDTVLVADTGFVGGGAFLSSIALIFIPNSSSLFMAASLLWLLDGSINIAMQPYRALVADIAPSTIYVELGLQAVGIAHMVFGIVFGSTLECASCGYLCHRHSKVCQR